MRRWNVTGEVRAPAGVTGTGSTYLINHNADNTLMTFRYRLKDVAMEAAEEPFEAAGRKYNRGSFIVRKAERAEIQKTATDLGVQIFAVETAPSVKTLGVKAPRIATSYLAKHSGRRLVAIGL